jgi:hypothetical protein
MRKSDDVLWSPTGKPVERNPEREPLAWGIESKGRLRSEPRFTLFKVPSLNPKLQIRFFEL